MVKGTETPIARCGHTMVTYGNEIYIYGGSIMNFDKHPEDIVIFNTSNQDNYIENQTYFIPEKTYNRSYVKYRRGHVAFSIKSNMVIHGGIDLTEKMLDCAWVFQTHGLRWEALETKGSPLGHRAYHSVARVVDSDSLSGRFFDLYKSSDLASVKSSAKKVMIQGIYFFGGIDENGVCHNDLTILKVGRRPCAWVTPKVDGKPPKPRICCSFEFYEELNYVILYGGKNNEDTMAECYKDVYILDLSGLLWCKAILDIGISDKMTRWGHSSGVMNGMLVIFGGVNGSSYMGSDVLAIWLDIVKGNSKIQEIKKGNTRKVYAGVEKQQLKLKFRNRSSIKLT